MSYFRGFSATFDKMHSLHRLTGQMRDTVGGLTPYRLCTCVSAFVFRFHLCCVCESERSRDAAP